MAIVISYLHFLSALVFIALGIIILTRDPRAVLNRACSLVFFCFFIWSAGYTVVQNPHVPQNAAKLFEDISSFGWIFFSGFFFWFSALFCRKRFAASSLFFAGIFAVPVFLEIMQLRGHHLTRDNIRVWYGWLALWNMGFCSWLFFIYYSLTCSVGLYWIWNHGRKCGKAVVRRQSVILVATAAAPLAAGSITNVVMPLLGLHAVPAAADIIILIWAGGMASVVLRFRMLCISPVVAAEQIISAMKDLLLLLDTQGTIMSLNRAARDALEYAPRELEGKPFATVVGGPQSERERLLSTIILSPTRELETCFVSKGGNLIPVVLSTSRLPGMGIVCVAHDVSLQRLRAEQLLEEKDKLETEVTLTARELKNANQQLRREVVERKRVADALEESEQRLKLIFDYAPDAIFLCDLKGNFIDCNREAERIIGSQKEELLGKNIISLNLLQPSQLVRAARLLTLNVLGKPTGPDEFTLNRTTGGQAQVEISTYPITIKERRLVLGIARDISARAKSEEEKKALTQELHQAQKMEAIGRLASHIAHDFNNLLGGIVGYADLLRLKFAVSAPPDSRLAGKIVEIARQAADLTTRLLAFARKGKYQVAAVDLHRIVQDVVEFMQRSVNKNVTFAMNLDARPSTVMGDRSQLSNALLNLAVNACDAMPGGGSVTFETAAVGISEAVAKSYPYKVAPGLYVKLSVADTGTGMDETVRAHAFEPFFTTKEPGKGTGLGLASVYGTVKNHNGFVEIFSRPGHGTAVVLCIPAVDAPADHEEKTGKASALPDKKKSGRILLCDDEMIIRDMTSEALAALGYTVTTCADGREAVGRYRDNFRDIDLVIIDLAMPGFSGSASFRAMKEANPAIKAVIMSGYAMDDEIGALLKEGVAAFLQKPFQVIELAEIIGKIL